MAVNVIKRTWLQDRMVRPETLNGMAFQAEAGAHRFEITGYDSNGNVMAFSGTVTAIFLRPDNTDVSLTGVISNGTAQVTLSQECYQVPGRFGLAIFVNSGNTKTVVYKCIGPVGMTSSGVAASSVVQSVNTLIDRIDAAINSIPQDYSALSKSVSATCPEMRDGSTGNPWNTDSITTKYIIKIDKSCDELILEYIGSTQAQYYVFGYSVFNGVADGTESYAARTSAASYLDYPEKYVQTEPYVIIPVSQLGDYTHIAFVLWAKSDDTTFIPLRIATEQNNLRVTFRHASYMGHEEINNRSVKVGVQNASKMASPLKLVHFSDLHRDVNAINRIRASAKYVCPNADNIICTGDMVANTYAEITSWWIPEIMTCIGNHDTASYDGTYDWTALTMAQRDEMYISPFKSYWGIVHTAGTSYYYKDYPTAHIRLIVMDAMLYSGTPGAEATAQTEWLADLLASAITGGLHVLIAIHAPHGGSVPVACSFTKLGQETMPVNVDCNTPDVIITTVATAIGNGLHFIGYICGHTHQDAVWDCTGDRSQLMYTVTCAAVDQTAQWANSDMYRSEELDAFNVLTIDTASTTIKILRGGGANTDVALRPRVSMVINYSTGKIITDTYASGTQDAVVYGEAQELTDAQKAQARANIGAGSAADVSENTADITANAEEITSLKSAFDFNIHENGGVYTIPSDAIEQGGFNSTDMNRIRVKGLIPVSKGQKITFNSGTKARQYKIGYYLLDGTYESESVWNTSSTIEITEDCCIRIMFRDNSSSPDPNIAPSDYDATTIIYTVWGAENKYKSEAIPENGQSLYLADVKSDSFSYINNAIAFNDGTVIAARANGKIVRIAADGSETTLLEISDAESIEWRLLWKDSAENVYASPHATYGTLNVSDRGLYRLPVNGTVFTKVIALYNPASSVATETQNGDDTIWTMCEDADGNLYAGVYAHTVRANPAIYKSTNGGINWTYFFNFNTSGLTDGGKHIHSLIFSKWKNALYCIVGEKNTVFKSTNGGSLWTNLNVPSSYEKGTAMLATPNGILIGSDGAYNCNVRLLKNDDATLENVYVGWASTVFALRRSDITGFIYAFCKIDSSARSIAYYPPYSVLSLSGAEQEAAIQTWKESSGSIYSDKWQVYHDSVKDEYPDDCIIPTHYALLVSRNGGQSFDVLKKYDSNQSKPDGFWTTGQFINGEILTGRIVNSVFTTPVVISEGKHGYNTLGESYTGEVFSRIGENIKPISENISPIEKASKSLGYCSSNGTWTGVNRNNQHVAIPVSGGNSLVIAGASNGTIIAALTEYSASEIVEGVSLHFSSVSNWTTRRTANSTEAKYYLPSDARYLLVVTTLEGNSRIPTKLEIDGFDYCKQTILRELDTENEIEENKIENGLSNGLIFGDYHNFYQITFMAAATNPPSWNTNGTSIVMKVMEGFNSITVYRNANKPSILCFCKEIANIHKGDAIDTATIGRVVISQEYQSFVIPDDAKYIVIMMAEGANDYSPNKILINGHNVSDSLLSNTAPVPSIEGIIFSDSTYSAYIGKGGTGDVLNNVTGADCNILIGHENGTKITSPSDFKRNVCMGYHSLFGIKSGSCNTAVGAESLDRPTGSRNTAVGYYSGAGANDNNNTFSPTVSDITAVGYHALKFNRGSNNTAVGSEALKGLHNGDNNIAIGYFAGKYIDDEHTPYDPEYEYTKYSKNLYIDALDRGNKANMDALSMIVGGFASTIGDQWIKFNAKVGFNGATPQGKQAIANEATDLQSAIILLNSIRSILINVGLAEAEN